MPIHPTNQVVPVVQPKQEEPERKVPLNPTELEVPLYSSDAAG